jgi:2-keto-3-deoxygluconate permease
LLGIADGSTNSQEKRITNDIQTGPAMSLAFGGIRSLGFLPMQILRKIQKVPGGLMVLPLLLGALLNTIDQLHLPFLQDALRSIGAAPNAEGQYEFLRIGGFAQMLFKEGAPALIGLFLFCVGSQITFALGGRALKKGAIVAGTKYASAVACGYLAALVFGPFEGLLGLSTVTIIAAMSNGNGGLYAALTSQYGNRSDVAAISVISLNDGPFLTLLALGLMGQTFPVATFLSVLIPLLLGMVLGNLDPEIRAFLAPGERLTIPFFAFALGAGMSFTVFFNSDVLAAGLLLGLATLLVTGLGAALMLRLSGERSQVAGVAEASTAGNAAATPFFVAGAAGQAASAGWMDPSLAAKYLAIRDVATAQISIAVMTTAILCPVFVILWHTWQKRRGINASEDGQDRAGHGPGSG